MEGWAKLGAALGGGGGNAAYEDQLLRNYRAQNAGYSRDKAMEDATMARNQRIALEGIGQTLAPLGLGDTAGIFQAGGGNTAQLTQGLLNLGEFNTRRDARGAALGGDLAGANANLISLGGPQDLTKISGDTAFNPMLGPQQPMYATDVGQSRIAEREASAGRYAAQAQKELALGGKYAVQAAAGGFAPKVAAVTTPAAATTPGVSAETSMPLGTPANTFTNPGDVVFVDPGAQGALPAGPVTRADLDPARFRDPQARQMAIAQARAAIEAGKDPVAVRARLRELGIEMGN